jgi:penicillin G amidase
MKNIGRYIQHIFLVAIILLLITLATVYLLVKESAPIYHGEIRTEHVLDTTKIIFGPYGVPHIYAKNNRDAFFSFGFVQAQERLFQMEVLRRVSAGRLAEIFGKELIPTDHFFRALNLSGHADFLADNYQKNTDVDIKICVDSYLQGINEYINRESYPPEFKLLGITPDPFTVKDIYLIAGYIAFSFTEAVRTDPNLNFIKNKYGNNYLAALGIDTTNINGSNPTQISDSIVSDNLYKLASLSNSLPIGIWSGSNAIVIDASHSTSGHVLFENDTHIKFQQPSVWYEAHINSPDYEVYGNYLAGLPFPLIGHNRSITWGLTMFENDDLNFYRETILSDNTYLHNGKEKKINVRSEVIKIKDQADTVVVIKSTVHGPLVNHILDNWGSEENGSAISLWWIYTKLNGDAIDVTYDLSSAQNIDEARSAASKMTAPGLNVIYGDTVGNIASWSAGKIPYFRAGLDTRFILDGESGNDDLLGFHPFEMNPCIENPPEGYIISANQRPQSHSFPIEGYYAPPHRYQRLQSLIGSRTDLSAGDLKSISLDNMSSKHKLLSDSLVVTILNNINIEDFNNKERSALMYLKNWDGKHDLTDIAPVIYYRTLSNVLEKTMKDELGEEVYSIFVNTHFFKSSCKSFLCDPQNPWWDVKDTQEVETREQIIISAFKKTIDELTHLFGTNIENWTWGGIHTLEHVHPIGKKAPFNHIFNVGPLAAPGGLETINNASFKLESSGRIKVTYGPAMRIVVDMKDPSLGWSINPTGQSGHFLSRHYSDQAAMFISGKFRYMVMDYENIHEQSKNTLTFSPVK